MLGYWHRRLNHEVFGSGLGPCALTSGSSPPEYGPVFGYYLPGLIHIDHRVLIKRELVNVLAHEMVHQLQDQLGLSVDHGKFFRAETKRLAKLGLEL